MANTIKMYPTKVSQPNRNQPSGLQGKCFKAVRRNGTTYKVNCSYQQDPRYHHEWSNAEEILKGNTIQCGRPSTKFCSHKTYYGIAGYRNTCPIAGISGTYTQPATLRLFFDLTKKGVTSTAKIEQVEISFEHRCTGVDVATGRETTTWGPNFNGFSAYPNKKPLTIKIGSETKTIDNNPPLSSKFSSIGKLIFKNVSYNDLVKNGIDIIYGNNFETNPGNIYLRNLSINVTYTDGTPYISGTQNKNSLYISNIDTCRSTIDFTIEAGYKQGTTKIPVKKSPNNLRDSILIKKPSSQDITVSSTNDSTDARKKIFTITDNTDIEGEKTITFYIKGTNKELKLKYNAIKRPKPTIIVPNQIEINTKNSNVVSIVAKNGCAKTITVYHDSIDNNPIYIFNDLNISTQDNIIKEEDINEFYKVLSQLPCGYQDLYFRRDNESNEEAIKKVIKIVPVQYKFTISEGENQPNITKYETVQNKNQNKTLRLTYVKTKDLISPPKFVIENPTHGPDGEIINNQNWDLSSEMENGEYIDFPVGTYYPGEYEIKIKERGNTCIGNPLVLPVKITPSHKQHFDEIFVRGEDSTAFNYEYLVAFEGDTITEPLFVNTISLGDSFKDIQICTEKSKIGRLGELNYITLKITNNSLKDIKNLFIELNTLIKDDDDNLQVTSNEWLENDGIFYNFKENFNRFNSNYNNFISIKNLTPDDDNVDEEDVYIHIESMKKHETLEIKVPFGCSKEKQVYLQLLLFGQPIPLYDIEFCPDSSHTFDKVDIRVYDSILTDMKITGEEDYFETEASPECPNECFKINAIEYSIKNIDTTSLSVKPRTVIINDPRLIPYKFEYNEEPYDINDNNQLLEVSFINKESNRHFPVIGARLDAYIQFDNHEEIHLHQYTDYQGETIFYITIPSTVGGIYTIKELLKHICIKYTGGEHYNDSKYVSLNTIYIEKNPDTSIYSDSKHNVLIQPIENQLDYAAGQVIPLKVKLIGEDKYLQNEILFKPNILTPGTKDSLKVYYKVCNLEKNEGKLKTIFKVEDDEYHLIPNQTEKTFYCGMDTDLTLYTKLTKIIVENKSINRLYLSLENKKRKNKDIEINIGENLDIEKYDVINYEIDIGEIILDNNKILWKINYINEDDIIRGHIDFKAKQIGYSTIETTVKDFIDKKKEEDPNLLFGEDSYKCDCRKVNK